MPWYKLNWKKISFIWCSKSMEISLGQSKSALIHSSSVKPCSAIKRKYVSNYSSFLASIYGNLTTRVLTMSLSKPFLSTKYLLMTWMPSFYVSSMTMKEGLYLITKLTSSFTKPYVSINFCSAGSISVSKSMFSTLLGNLLSLSPGKWDLIFEAIGWLGSTPDPPYLYREFSGIIASLVWPSGYC